MLHSFNGKLDFSRGKREATDIETIKAMLPGCTRVEKTSEKTDRQGIDYIAYLRRGAEIFIDAKTREAGASNYWKHGEPEIPLEIWSIRPGGKYGTPEEQKKTGWTLCEQSLVDLILFTFDPQDSDDAFLISFQLLRAAFVKHFYTWSRMYDRKTQESHNNGSRWESECVFVPINVVLNAITDTSCGKLVAA